MIKKQNLDRILLRITIISDRFNILGILLIYIIILRKRYSKVGSIQKESEKNQYLLL